jgi:hypothetical protein
MKGLAVDNSHIILPSILQLSDVVLGDNSRIVLPAILQPSYVVLGSYAAGLNEDEEDEGDEDDEGNEVRWQDWYVEQLGLQTEKKIVLQ